MNGVYDDVTSDPVELAWLAGLLEGEGCFLANKYATRPNSRAQAVVTVAMTDIDVIERAKSAMGVSQKKTTFIPSSGNAKAAFKINVASTQAEKVMLAVLPHMGARRSLRIKEILAMDLSHRPRQAA